jgi:hypothetical protein
MRPACKQDLFYVNFHVKVTGVSDITTVICNVSVGLRDPVEGNILLEQRNVFDKTYPLILRAESIISTLPVIPTVDIYK